MKKLEEKVNQILEKISFDDMLKKKGKEVAVDKSNPTKKYYDIDGIIYGVVGGGGYSKYGPIDKFKRDVKNNKIKARLV